MESASQRVECALTWFSTSVQQLFIISLLVSLPVTLMMSNSIFDDKNVVINQNKWLARAFLGFRL